MTDLAFKIYMDMDRDGDFTDSGDDITDDVMGAEWNIGMREAFQLTADESRLTLTMRNHQKKYSPENTSGTYTGKLLPQRPVKIDAIYDGGTATLYTGWVDDFAPTPFERGTLTSIVTCTGAKQFLGRTEVYLELMQMVTVDDVLRVIFDQVVFPPSLTAAWLLGVAGNSELGVSTFLYASSAAYNFEVGGVNFSYVGDGWENGVRAYDIIERLMRSERGRFYFDRGGTAVFLNRQNFQAHYANDGTVDNTMGGAVYDFGADLYNVARVTCSPRQITAGTVTLWSLDTPVRVEAGEQKTINARYTDDSGAQIGGYNVGTPSITASTGITLASFEPLARSADATFSNSSSSAGSVTAMDITGQKITAYRQLEVEEQDAELAAIYGRRVLDLNCDLLDSEQQARYVAQFELARHKFPRGTMRSVTIQKRTAANMAMMFNRTIGDRINVKEDQTEHDEDYFIVGEKWTLSKGLKSAAVEWSLEPASATNFAILDTTGHNQLDVNAYLGF